MPLISVAPTLLDLMGLDKPRIDAALKEFWFDRAENAPTQEVVESHLQEEETTASQHPREEKQ